MITFFWKKLKAHYPSPKSKMNPVCCLCGETCENTLGNNPHPFYIPNSSNRCCDKCNMGSVIPARLRGIFRCKDLNEEDKKEILDECREICEEEWEELMTELYREHNPQVKLVDLSALLKIPVLVELTDKIREWTNLYDKTKKEVFDACMGYLAKRLERHIKVRFISSPKDLCFTLSGFMRCVGCCDIINLISKQKILLQSCDEVVSVAKKRAEDELLAGGGAVSQPKEKVKTKEQEKKEQVKKQNKANEEERKIKEKQDREQAIAYEKRLEQQKKRQREIEIKKRKALLANISK